jgi:hypothetical protein
VTQNGEWPLVVISYSCAAYAKDSDGSKASFRRPSLIGPCRPEPAGRGAPVDPLKADIHPWTRSSFVAKKYIPNRIGKTTRMRGEMPAARQPQFADSGHSTIELTLCAPQCRVGGARPSVGGCIGLAPASASSSILMSAVRL